MILVFLRYVLNQSITGANEIATILFIYTTIIGSSVSISRDEHISIDLLTGIISSESLKFIKIVQVLLILSLQCILLLYCLDWLEKAGGYLMPATGLPRIVAIASIPIGCSLSIFYCLLKLISIGTGYDFNIELKQASIKTINRQ